MTFPVSDIISTFRNVTATQTQYSVTDIQILDLVNKYYAFVLPDEMKPYKTLVPFTMTTLANQLNYPIDQQQFYALIPEFFINGNRLLYYQDQSLWTRDFQYQYNQVQIATGTGAPFPPINYTVGQTPIIPGTVIVTDGIENLTDPNLDGVLVSSLTSGQATGTINYTTGLLQVTYNTNPPLGNGIIVTWAPLINGRPRAMFYNYGSGNVQFSPIPDQAYQITGQAYVTLQSLSLTGSPLIREWGYTIAYGAALEFFSQRGQLDLLASYQPRYDMYLDRAIGHWGQQATNQRSVAKW